MIRLQTRLLLVMALVAAVFTQLPRAVDPRLEPHSRLRPAATQSPSGTQTLAWPPLRHA